MQHHQHEVMQLEIVKYGYAQFHTFQIINTETTIIVLDEKVKTRNTTANKNGILL